MTKAVRWTLGVGVLLVLWLQYGPTPFSGPPEAAEGFPDTAPLTDEPGAESHDDAETAVEPEPLPIGIPEPPAPWMATYSLVETDAEAFDRLRETLFRHPDDATVIRGLTWLAHARSHEVRHTAARALAEAYLLGDQLGTSPVPGIRRLAADPDPSVRMAVLSDLALHDSPLARELALAYVTGEIPIPVTDAGRALRQKAEETLAKLAHPSERSRLVRASPAERIAWARSAPVQPATRTTGRFETGVIETGRENAVALKTAPGVTLWIEPVTVVRSAGGRIGSGDWIMAWMGLGGRTGGGGATPYTGGTSSNGHGWRRSSYRHLGGNRVRYWIRVDQVAPPGWKRGDFIGTAGPPPPPDGSGPGAPR